MNARTLFFAWGDGSFSCRFFLHGWRYVNAAAQERLAALEPDETLYVTLELTNPRDGVAVRIQTEDSHMIGWAPRYRVRDLATAMAEAPSRYTARVVRMKPAGSGIGVSTGLDDPFVPVLALDAEERGLIVGGQLDKTRWESHARKEGLDSSDWLVAYEGAVRGWLTSDTARMVDEHPVFGWLRTNDVSFFDHKAPVVWLNRWISTSQYGEGEPEPQSGN